MNIISLQKLFDAQNKNKTYYLIFIFLILFSFRIIRPVIKQSSTYDEGMKIGSSYVLVKHKNLIYDRNNPPLFKYFFSIPLIILNPDIPIPSPQLQSQNPKYFYDDFTFGYRFLYYNSVSASKLIISTRMVSFIFYLMGGIFLFFSFRKIVSFFSAILATTFYFFCPNLAASGALSTNDIFAAVFTILFFASFIHFIKTPNLKTSVFTGISLGSALCIKFNLMIFLPIYAVSLVILLYKKKGTLKELIFYSAVIFGMVFIIFESNYLLIKPEKIYAMIKELLSGMEMGMMAYALGNYSREGFWYYYPLAFLLKTPVPILLIVFYSLYVFFKEKKYKDDSVLILFLGIAMILAAGIRTKINLGLRYMLPLFVMLYMFAAIVLKEKEKKFVKIFPLIFAGLLTSNILIHPHYQSYFNILIGKNVNGYKYFVDSTLDWGQDLGYLGSYLRKENNPEIMLSYFGTSKPEYYGIIYQNLACNGLDHAQEEKLNKHINSDNPKKEFLAVSATNLVGLNYPDHTWFDFLKNSKPKKIIGNTIFVYDITNKIDIYKNIAKIYSEINYIEHFLRTGRRVAFLDPEDDFGKICNAISILYYQKDVKLSEKSYDEVNIDNIKISEHKNLLINSAILYCGSLIRADEYDLAIERLNSLVRFSSGDSGYKIYHFLGMSYLKKENLKLAEENFVKCLKLKPNYYVVHYNLGILYEKDNKHLKAKDMYLYALKINPNYIPARMKLEYLNKGL